MQKLTNLGHFRFQKERSFAKISKNSVDTVKNKGQYFENQPELLQSNLTRYIQVSNPGR
jgi:hypothetical protein